MLKNMYKKIALFVLMIFCLSCHGPAALNPNALAQENACIQSLQIGDYQGAQTRCQLCLEYNEQVPECINGLGLVAFANNDLKTATKYFTQAIQMSSFFAQARNNLGAIYFKEQNYPEAITLFSAAVKIDPGYEDARYNLALSYLRMGQKDLTAKNNASATKNFSLAQEQYRLLMAVDANYANAYRDMGLIMTYQASMETDDSKIKSDLDDANKYFKQCLVVDSVNEGCLESYGHTLLYLNDFDDALYQFVQCLSINKKNSVCIQGMDAAYNGSALKSSALAAYMKVLKANPNDAQGHLGYCSILFQKNLNEQAVAECQTAIRLNAKLCDAYFQLGMYYKSVLNSGEALSNCKSYVLCDQNGDGNNQVSQCNTVITTLSGS